MNRLTILLSFIIFNGLNIFGQSCSSLFSFTGYFEKITFYNQSSVSNAYYYWNFGDGTSSYLKNPTHVFPETGTFFVTLFVNDTINNCSSYYDYWINVTKNSIDNCQPNISDSTFFYNGKEWIKLIDNSTNCNGYYSIYDFGGNFNASKNAWFGIGYMESYYRYIARVKFLDSTYATIREGYKSMLHQYSSAKNYTNCSANFEFSIVSEDTIGQRILFKAMNKNATYYEWNIVGFGDAIYSNNDTISQYYIFNHFDLGLIGLNTIGINGCRDTLWQQILIRKGINTTEGINEIENNNTLQIYPNPTSSILNIVDEQTQLLNSIIDITNYLGQSVFSEPFSNQIDVSHFPSGVYTINIKTISGELYHAKLIKN